ncbi:MAG: hypothetical protein NTZ25_04075 [Candidatus Peregrinibacteria bacterium]|nr:hypothetical protein [Candidatus Peregrinibacteria bacterium]
MPEEARSVDDSEFIFKGTPGELDVELRKLGVSGGVNGIREDGKAVMSPVVATALDPEIVAAASRTMRRQMAEFMAAQRSPVVESDVGDVFFAKPIEIAEDRKRATAVGKMRFNYGWSTSLVHSSDMMFSAGSVVEALLSKGEEVAGVEALRFMDPVQNNIEWHACVDELAPDVVEKCSQIKPDVKATFLIKDPETGNERKILLFGFQNNESARSNAHILDMANLPTALSTGFSKWKESVSSEGDMLFEFDLSRPDLRVSGMELGISMNTVMELVMSSFNNVKMFIPSDFYGRFGSLAYGFDFKKLPKVEELDQNCKLVISLNKKGIVVKPNGIRVVPLKFLIKRFEKVVAEGVYQSAHKGV